MTDANVQVARAAYAAFLRGDVPAILGLLAPRFTFGMVGRPTEMPHLGLRDTPEGVVDFFVQLALDVEFTRFEPQRFVAAEDLVVVLGQAAYVVRANGVSGSTDWVHVFELQDGRIASWRAYEDTAQMLVARHPELAAA